MATDIREQVVDSFISHLPKHLGIKPKHKDILKNALAKSLSDAKAMIIPRWQSRIVTESQINEAKTDWLNKSAERIAKASWRQDIPVR
jgi:predicted nucleotide-binding protein (sugar kinase/HSP70/actin superfamily)